MAEQLITQRFELMKEQRELLKQKSVLPAAEYQRLEELLAEQVQRLNRDIAHTEIMQCNECSSATGHDNDSSSDSSDSEAEKQQHWTTPTCQI